MKEDKSKYEKFKVVPCRTKKKRKTTEKNENEKLGIEELLDN